MAESLNEHFVVGELRKNVTSRAGERCEYCRMHQSLQGATFHIEHAVPKSLGGSSEIDNLALACPSCNLHKSDRLLVDLVGKEKQVPLYNPRRDSWTEHFDWDEYSVASKTDAGKATIDALFFNHERRIKIRMAEQLFGLFPPDSS